MNPSKQWQTTYEIASAQLTGAMPELEEVLGIAYLHKSETRPMTISLKSKRSVHFSARGEPKLCKACVL